MTDILFDDSLPQFAALVERAWGRQALVDNVFLRDVTGRLTLIVLDPLHSFDQRNGLALLAEAEMAPYVDLNGQSVTTPDELFDTSLSDPADARTIDIRSESFAGSVKVIDRRLVGADWLRAPAGRPKEGPARIVFASLKGGVGRSTALCVAAAHLAGTGKRVLAVDMDLEAPGLGNLLLPGDTLPRHGLLDYLVEKGLRDLDDEFYADLVGGSWLAAGRGRVDVVPAIGSRSLNNPANVLAKIARAYIGGAGIDGNVVTFADQISALIERFADPYRYDVILIDARAGLHETTAAALVGLGADILLFGIDQPQTYAAYELLLAHLNTLPRDPIDDWRYRFHFVQAKCGTSDREPTGRFIEKVGDLLDRYFFPRPAKSGNLDVAELANTFEVDWAEGAANVQELIGGEEIESPFLAVMEDPRFAAFDPAANKKLLEPSHYAPSFGGFLSAIEDLISENIENEQGTAA